MKSTTWNTLMDNLKSEHQVISDLIGEQSVAYIDIPIHFNVGDILIYQGTEAFFKNCSVKVDYRGDYKGLDYKKLAQVDVILLHGGGNFGDLYDVHQNLREGIAKRFPEKMIVCLPQSIHFKDDNNLEKSAQVFKAHPNFHFCVRDLKSQKIAQKFTDNVLLLPDMAHQLHPLVEASETGHSNITPAKILNLQRVDIEKTGKTSSLNKKSFDWTDLLTTEDQCVYHLYHKLKKIPFCSEMPMKLWAYHSERITFRAVNYFSLFSVIYTDRLHGLILAALLGKPVHLADNAYGKNTNYHQQWLVSYPYMENL
jgi:exopolysaccharide biosynthesis predicted pyruvyltransferase EpsI